MRYLLIKSIILLKITKNFDLINIDHKINHEYFSHVVCIIVFFANK
jgi:hypothetical protein